jgi:uncharacterized zinc-type alcohol dehydrogenase-like protein
MTLNTNAYAAYTANTPLAPYTFERRDPLANDVVIDIQYCGICHSDIHQVREEWDTGTFPMVPGHEITGIVKAIGPQVTRYKVGDRVGVGVFVDSCRDCEECRNHLEQYCSVGTVWTYNSRDKAGLPTYGGYSDTIVVDENYVLRIPDNLPLDASAPLLCAGITLYSPLRHWGAGPGASIAIVGVGGLGHIGVKLAHALGAEVTALSHSMKKEADAARLGADHFYATSDPNTFKKLDRTFDLIVNTVSAGIDWNAYLNLLKVDGTLVIVGLPPDDVPVSAGNLTGRRLSLAGSNIGGMQETQEMLDFCGQHNIACDVEVIPMQQVNDAYERVLRSDVRYRFVIDMASIKSG